MCNKVASRGGEDEQGKGNEEERAGEGRNLAAYCTELSREREMSVMVSALSDVVAGATGVKREREGGNEIQPNTRLRASPHLSLPPSVDFNLDPPRPVRLSYPTVQRQCGAQIPMTAPATASSIFRKNVKYLSYHENSISGNFFFSMKMAMKFMLLMIILASLFIITTVAETHSAQTVSDSDINQYITANCVWATVVHSGHGAVTVGDGKHDSTQVDGMNAEFQNPESGKKAKLESFTPMGRGLIDGQGEKLWAGRCKWFNEQKTVAIMERVVKGRKLLEPDNPNPDRGHDPQHH